MSGRRLSKNQTLLGRYGDGGSSNRAEWGRWRIIKGHSSLDMWVPEKSAAERNSVYDKFPIKYGSAPAYGVYYPSRYGIPSQKYLYDNTTRMGTGPCWNNYFAGSYLTPGGCPSGFTDLGVTNTSLKFDVEVAATQSRKAGVLHNNPMWMFFIENGWGCTASYPWTGISIRQCRMTAQNVSGYR
jgi:hypothetical protein